MRESRESRTRKETRVRGRGRGGGNGERKRGTKERKKKRLNTTYGIKRLAREQTDFSIQLT